MSEWLEIYEQENGQPMMIPLDNIGGITPIKDGAGAWLKLKSAMFGGMHGVRIVEPTYAELRDLLQPINVVR